MDKLLSLFAMFLKINLLTTSGPASVGLLHEEAVARSGVVTEEEFVEAVGFGSVLPGSDALQTAMFVGYRVAKIPGALAATFAATLPPTIIMLGVALLLDRVGKQPLLEGFVKGLEPTVAVILVFTAFKLVGLLGKGAPVTRTQWTWAGIVFLLLLILMGVVKYVTLAPQVTHLFEGCGLLSLGQWFILLGSAIALFGLRLDAVPVLLASALLGTVFLS